MKKIVESHIVEKVNQETRLCDYAKDVFISIRTKSGIKKAIKKQLLEVNGKIGFSSDYVKNGDELLLFQEGEIKKHKAIDLKLEVLFEDDYLAIINKPAGIVVSGNRHWTIQNALGNNLTPSTQKDALSVSEPIHRLDYPTSGVLLIGKTSTIVTALNDMFKAKTIRKTYHAITIQEMEEDGVVEQLIDGKASLTNYHVIDKLVSPKFQFLNLVELKPATGRKHQIRKHMASLGNPIFGDLEYGIEGMIYKGRGLHLHASSLSFVHPITKQLIDVFQPLPKKFLQLFPN